MKHLLVIIMSLMATIGLAQQLPTLKPLTKVLTEQVSLANPYVGVAKLAYNLDPDRSLENNLIFSAGAQIVPIRGERFAIPILGVGGLGSSDILNPNSGLNIGVFPYYYALKQENLQVVLHVGANYKTIVEGVGADETAPQQLKFLGGAEIIYAKDADSLPFTFSVSPTYLYHTDDATGNTAAIELTAVVPIAEGLGLLAEGFAPLGDKFKGLGQFRFAVITTF